MRPSLPVERLAGSDPILGTAVPERPPECTIMLNVKIVDYGVSVRLERR